MGKREKILELRSQGLSYNEIAAAVPCSKGTVSYHLGEGQKEKTRQRSIDNPPDAMAKRLSAFRNRQSVRATRKFTGDITRTAYWKARDFQRRITGGFLSSKDLVQTFTHDDVVGKFGSKTNCYLTGAEIDLDDPQAYHFDHIVPVSKGGDNSIGNLGICTPLANYMKRDLTVEEFVGACRQVVDWYDSGLDTDGDDVVR